MLQAGPAAAKVMETIPVGDSVPDPRVQKQEVTLRASSSALLPSIPVDRVPALEPADRTILTESLLILNYIDTYHAGHPPPPKDAADR